MLQLVALRELALPLAAALDRCASHAVPCRAVPWHAVLLQGLYVEQNYTKAKEQFEMAAAKDLGAVRCVALRGRAALRT